MFRVDNSTAAVALPAPAAAGAEGYFTDGDPQGGVPATVVPADWLNLVQEEIAGVITAAGITLDKTKTDQLREALKSLAVYDVPFLAGWGVDMTGEDLAVQTYGAVVATRAFNVIGDVGRIETVNTAADLLLDVAKNGVSIYTTKPTITATTGAYTAGVLTSDPNPFAFAAGDLLEFKVAQIGATIAGQKLSFGLKGYV